jgi:hypothetical protein
VKAKTFMIAGLVVGVSLLIGAAGCSSDDEGAKGFSCPKAGDKPCANDPAVTEATANSCKQCEAENRAYSDCLGGTKCNAAGKTEEPPLSSCPDQLSALIKCVQGGSSSGGTDAGGGG